MLSWSKDINAPLILNALKGLDSSAEKTVLMSYKSISIVSVPTPPISIA